MHDTSCLWDYILVRSQAISDLALILQFGEILSQHYTFVMSPFKFSRQEVSIG